MGEVTVHDEILEVLVALDEGDGTVDEIAATTGRNPLETQALLERLSQTGFIAWHDPAPDHLGGFHLSQSGRTLLRLGYEEAFKRNLNARLGGDEDSAS